MSGCRNVVPADGDAPLTETPSKADAQILLSCDVVDMKAILLSRLAYLEEENAWSFEQMEDLVRFKADAAGDSGTASTGDSESSEAEAVGAAAERALLLQELRKEQVSGRCWVARSPAAVTSPLACRLLSSRLQSMRAELQDELAEAHAHVVRPRTFAAHNRARMRTHTHANTHMRSSIVTSTTVAVCSESCWT